VKPHLRVQREATALAEDSIVRRPVGCFTVPAHGASAAGSSGIDQRDRHAALRCRGGEVLAQGEEGPGGPRVALVARTRDSLPNTTQGLASEWRARSGGLGSQLLAEAVVDLLWEASLTTAPLAQVPLGAPLGAPRAHLLQPLVAPVGARAGTVAHSAREVLAVRGPWSVVRGPWSVVRGQVDDPPVYAQRSTGGSCSAGAGRRWVTLGDAG